jgi:hypothetical protein
VIEIRRYASGIVIVEPSKGQKQPDPTSLAGPDQRNAVSDGEIQQQRRDR